MGKVIGLVALTVFYFTFFLVDMIRSVGKVSKESVYDISLPVTYVIVFVSIFVLGFALAWQIKKTK